MQYKRRATQLRWLAIFVGLCLSSIGIFQIASAARNGADPSSQQDVIRLESRLTQLEQRLFSMDTSLRNLEQQLRLAGAAGRGVSTDDLLRLNADLQTLRHRVAEHECALAKLDERTLSPSARKKSGSGDPCRLNFETPLRLADHR